MLNNQSKSLAIKTLIENLEKRNIKGLYFENLNEVKKEILEIVSNDSTVGIGNSKTLKEMNISEELSNRRNIVYDKTFAKSKEESKELKKKALLTDWYISSSNAISLDGHIVNIDHSGNRVAALTYGPEKVIIVISTNKIEKNLDEAINRARNYAAPLNAKRAGFHPPCTQLGRCTDCKTKERVCYYLSIIEGQYLPDRMKVFIVDEKVGF